MNPSDKTKELADVEWLKSMDVHSQIVPHFNEQAQQTQWINQLPSVSFRKPDMSTTNVGRPISPMRRDTAASSSQAPIVVAAPIPISYAVKNRSALRHMLSLGEEDQDNKEVATGTILKDQANHAKQAPTDAAKPNSNDSKMAIRPISPDTLIALADPCIFSRLSETSPPPIQYPLPPIFQHNGPNQSLPIPSPETAFSLDVMLDLPGDPEQWFVRADCPNTWGY